MAKSPAKQRTPRQTAKALATATSPGVQMQADRNSLGSRSSSLLHPLYLQRVSIAVVAVFCLAITSDQSLELLRLAGGSAGDNQAYSWLTDSIFLMLLPMMSIVAVGLIEATSAELRSGGNRGQSESPTFDIGCFVFAWLLAATLPVCFGLALMYATLASDATSAEHMRFWGRCHVTLGIVLVVFAVWMSIGLSKERRAGTDARAGFSVPAIHRTTMRILVGACIFAVAFLIVPNESLAVAPMAFVLWTALVIALLGVLAHLSRRTGIPFTSALLVWLVVMAATGWDDHHTIETSPTASIPVPVDEAFRSWRSLPPSSPNVVEPVFVVAAQGGGIRAAVMTGMVLDELRKRAPTFGEHLFAIVGVSGGSVGAAGFAAAMHQGLPPVSITVDSGKSDRDGWQRSLQTDLLSPTLRDLLFRELPGRLIPRPLIDLSSHDRARRLERVLAERWRLVNGVPVDDLMFQQVHRPGERTPALVLMTTSNQGKPVAISHLRLVGRGERDPATGKCRAQPDVSALTSTMFDEAPGLDVSLLTAAFMSARFPGISPAARLEVGGRPPEHFLDGGYFENSGVSTALDIVRSLQCEAAGRSKIIVIRIENGAEPDNSTSWRANAFLDLLLPAATLMETGAAHGARAVAELDAAVRSSKTCTGETCPVVEQITFRVTQKLGGVPLPLGWFITGPARNEIARQLLLDVNEKSFEAVAAALGPNHN